MCAAPLAPPPPRAMPNLGRGEASYASPKGTAPSKAIDVDTKTRIVLFSFIAKTFDSHYVRDLALASHHVDQQHRH